MGKRLALDLFGLELTLTNGHELLVLRPKRNEAAWPRSHKPTRRGGRPADHVSVSLKPLRSGPHAGKYAVHLTWGRNDREFLCAITPAELERMGKRLERVLVRHHLRNLRSVTKRQLAHENWRVIRPTPSSIEEVASTIVKRAGRYAITQAHAERAEVAFARHLRLMPPWLLDFYRERHPDYPLQLVRVVASGETEAALAYYYDTPGLRGWFLQATNWHEGLKNSGVLQQLFGPGVHQVALTVLRELQADCDVDAVISQAESAPTTMLL